MTCWDIHRYTEGRKSIRAPTLCDICGSNLSLHLPNCLVLFQKLLTPWYFADITNERAEETYELRENIDSINQVENRWQSHSQIQQSENGIHNVKILISLFWQENIVYSDIKIISRHCCDSIMPCPHFSPQIFQNHIPFQCLHVFLKHTGHAFPYHVFLGRGFY